MQIFDVDINQIKPYAKNAKLHPDEQIGRIANSIHEFGFRQPLVIDKDNVLVIGHGRYAAAKRLGYDTVPCLMADDLTEEQIKALRLADNKTNESDWDIDFLNVELDDITNIDMSQFGFDLGDDDEVEEPDIDEYDDIEKLDTHYGVPYQGNKSRIADIIISILPAGERLVDLFGGGGCDHALCYAGRQVALLFI